MNEDTQNNDGVNEALNDAVPKPVSRTEAQIKDEKINAAVRRLAGPVREALKMEETIAILETNEATNTLVVENVESASKELESVKNEIANVATVLPEGAITIHADGSMTGSPVDLAHFMYLNKISKKALEYRAVS